MARILALSSHVVRGSVGLAATVPALQSLGHEVWAVPTVTLAARPGLGTAALAPFGRRATTAEELAGMLEALEQDGCWPLLDAVFAGYFASADAVGAAASAIARIRAAAPHVRVLIDPILGDAGRLYVPATTAAAIRDLLVPLADIATPNRFELEWLTGARIAEGEAAMAAAARRLGPATVVVTSARETADAVATALVTGDRCIVKSSQRLHGLPNGSGDLLDGLLLGHLLHGKSQSEAFEEAVTILARVLAASTGRDVLQLAVLVLS